MQAIVHTWKVWDGVPALSQSKHDPSWPYVLTQVKNLVVIPTTVKSLFGEVGRSSFVEAFFQGRHLTALLGV